MHSAGTVIAHLRLRAAPRDPLATRLRMSNVLSGADLSPAGLPATAIVFIRSLHDPLPRRLRLAQAGHAPAQAWQQAVGREIDALARRAARPARGFVAESAEAVWFSDRSELLACLARDWCSGALAARWWWRALLRNTDSARAVIAEWLQSPEYAPAAMQQLSITQHAHLFVQRLPDDVARQWLLRAGERFGLSALHRRLLGDPGAAMDSACDRHPPPGDAGENAGYIHYAARGPSPWLPWVPEVAQVALSRAQINFLGITLLLARAPGVARSAAWAEILQTTIVDVAPGAPVLQPNAASPIGAAQAPVHDRTDHLIQSTATRTSTVSASAPRVDLAADRPSLGNGGAPSSRTLRPDTPSTPVIPQKPASVNAHAASVHPEQVLEAGTQPQAGPRAGAMALTNPSATHITNTTHGLPTPWAGAQGVESAFGGALFLINLGLFLELYGDFSQPARPGIELPIWDFVAWVGEACVGRAIRHDAVWRLLAELSARQTGEEPGCHFQPPVEWRMPLNWLTPFAAVKDWHWHGRRGRLQVRHPAGFVVLDVAVPQRNYARVLAEELAPYCAAGLCVRVTRARGTRRHAPGRAPWLCWLRLYVRARLSAALGLRSMGRPGKLLCSCPARLHVTPTHLDAYFTLARLPIEVRLAGLDRDPGWVPAAGRYIRFHFD